MAQFFRDQYATVSLHIFLQLVTRDLLLIKMLQLATTTRLPSKIIKTF